MKIPQLFVRIGKDKYLPVERPKTEQDLYFWDEEKQQIVPTDDRLKRQEIEGSVYLVF